jgi:hypothetical protein
VCNKSTKNCSNFLTTLDDKSPSAYFALYLATECLAHLNNLFAFGGSAQSPKSDFAKDARSAVLRLDSRAFYATGVTAQQWKRLHRLILATCVARSGGPKPIASLSLYSPTLARILSPSPPFPRTPHQQQRVQSLDNLPLNSCAQHRSFSL